MICALCNEFPRVLQVHTCGREACDVCRKRGVCCDAASQDAIDKAARRLVGEHSSATPEHYSPEEWVERGRRVMGSIDFDPASCAEANETVRANVWYGVEENGLLQSWFGNGWINPPGDETGSLPPAFFAHLAHELAAGHVTQFVWLAFNLAQLRTLQGPPASRALLRECSLYIPPKRIRFTGGQPTKDNAFLYWGENRERFVEVFSEDGGVFWHP